MSRQSPREPTPGWTLELRDGRAVYTRGPVALTVREYRLLCAFLRHPGQTLTREQLLAQAWPDEPRTAANTVEQYVGYLRRKLGGPAIRTAHGVGSRLEVDLRDLS